MRSLTILIAVMVVVSCTAPEKTSEENNIDTIQTASGLQYYYLTKGTGRKVEAGASVSTKLSLLVEDSVVWTSYEAQDSLFSFIVGVDGVIRGFEEMALLMNEGDNVVAILPDSLAYGDKGAGDVIPPGATLVYDRYEMVSVSEPKIILTDTLTKALESGGVDLVMSTYQGILNSDHKEEYHYQPSSLRTFLGGLLSKESYSEVEAIAEGMETISESIDDKGLFGYFIHTAAEKQGKIEKALSVVNKYLEVAPDNSYLINKKQELEEKIAQEEE